MKYIELKNVTKEIYHYPSFYGMEHLVFGVPVICGEHIDEWGRISTNWADYWFISPEVSAQFPRTILEENDIVFTVRGTIGKVGLVSSAHEGAQLSPNLIRLSPSREIDARFLWYFLQFARDEIISAIQNEVTIASVRAGDLGDIRIPFPPLDEQRRIAAILHAADDERRRRRYTQSLSASLLRETFVQMFGDPATNPMGWQIEPFANYIVDMRNGLSPSSDGTVNGKVLMLSAITRDYFDPNEYKWAAFVDTYANYLVNNDDFLICRGNGNLNLVGRGKYPFFSMEDTVFPDTMIATRLNANLSPKYIEVVWSQDFVRTQIEAGARTTNGTHKINQQVIEAISIPVPPLELQNRFAAIATKHVYTRRQQAESARQGEHLFQTLLHQAFRGEL